PAFVLSQDQTLRECFPVIGMNTTRAEQSSGISPTVHSVLAVFSSKEPRHQEIPVSGYQHIWR
ncbi:hypothetical protein ACFV29_28560, partial [Streptomyces sp. NPDC059690]|uniref:hypothetical protein n=1 Tax=Streptomyces sp. NPDC059690 TaxID=3346907 RepID=UPI0036BEB462